MTIAARALADFAAKLTYDELPHNVAERAKDCIIHTIGVAMFGAQFPWSRMAADYARRYGSGGMCSIIGVPDAKVQTPYAALANGVAASAFEMDSTRHPGVGAHDGATLLPAILAASEETGADGKASITAYVAGCEVLVHIAMAAHGSRVAPESLGFHLPGLIGPYAAAIAAGRLFGLDADGMQNALGIAGSLSSGLLAFTKSEQGGMIKRLHLGRAAESGVLAARLAAAGYTGPETILEGQFGLLKTYCRDPKPELLTQGLGSDWETLRIGMKRYACHVCNQTPIQSLRELMVEHAFTGNDVEKVIVEGVPKLVTHHNILEPGDIMQGQYSVPFCLAVALFRDPEDPRSFGPAALEDVSVRAACRSSIEVRARDYDTRSTKHTRIDVSLKDGRKFTRETDTYKGLPANPLSREELRRKFMYMAPENSEGKAAEVFTYLEQLESQRPFSISCI